MAAELAALIDAALDGVLDEAGAAELRRRLAGDPLARQAWWAEVALRSQLGEVLAQARARRSGIRLRPRPVASRPPAWALAAAAVLALGLAWLLWSPAVRLPGPAPLAVVPEPAGLRVIAVEGQVDGARSGASLAAGAVLGGPGSAVLAAADGSRLTLSRGRLVVLGLDGPRLRLEDGLLQAVVEQHPVNAPLLIETPQARATVLGTRLRVAVDAGASLLEVEEGRVAWREAAGSERIVAAGERALAEAAGQGGRSILVQPGQGPSLATACAEARPGDRILLADGIHALGGDERDFARLAVSGSAAAPIRIQAAPGARPRIRSSAWNALNLDAASHIILSGLDIEAAPGTSIPGNGIFLEGCSEVQVVGCRVLGFGGEGLGLIGSTAIGIRDLVVEGCGARSPYGQGGVAVQAAADGGERVRPFWRIRISGLRSDGNRCALPNQATGSLTGGQGLLINGLRLAAGAGPDDGVQVEDYRAEGNDGPALMVRGSEGIRVAHATWRGNGRLDRHDNPCELASYAARDVSIASCLLLPLDGHPPWRGDTLAGIRFPASAWWGSGPEVEGLGRLDADPALAPPPGLGARPGP